MDDYYRLLKVTPHASAEEIRRAFRQQAKRCHPDLYHNAPLQEKKQHQKQFVLLTQAYETLSDPKRRHQYDLKFQQHSAKKQKPHAKASSSSRRTYRPPDPPPFTKKSPPNPPPFADSTDENLEDLITEVEELMEKFGGKFRDPLEILVQWALKVFEEFASAWKEDESGNFQQSTRPQKEKKYSMFQEIEEEFQKLKTEQFQQAGTASHQQAKARSKSPSNSFIDRELRELKKKYGKSS